MKRLEWMRKRVAFVTIGQSPRDDVVPEMLAQIPEIDAVMIS
jgi:hypothetical protein